MAVSSDSRILHVWLLRHGNTFSSSDPVIWLGRNDDPPMVPDGFRQIEKAAEYIRTTGLIPRAGYCAPYRRTRQSLAILQTALHDFPVRQDARLCELDYGDWNGRTNRQIEHRYGPEMLEAWRNCGVFPVGLGWTPTEEEVKREIISLLAELLQRHTADSGVIVIAAPNARLRYFLQVVERALETLRQQGRISICTGHLGRLTFHDDSWHLAEWDRSP